MRDLRWYRMTASSRARLLAGILAAAAAPRQSIGQHPLVRRYVEHDSIAYVMRAVNAGHTDTVRYEGLAAGRVERDSSGRFVERLSWSNFRLGGTPVRLASAAAARQILSLDSTWRPVPDVRGADPRLIGPILDLFTFYVDLKLAASQAALVRSGDHVSVPVGLGGSWADGRQTLIAQDAIDFDVTLQKFDSSRHEAVVVVRHIPPASLKIRLPAAWMAAPIAATPNNWVEVARAPDESFYGRVGSESFTVTLHVSLLDGRLLAASMDNPVEVLERHCTDAALTACGEPVRYLIRRTIELGPP